MNEMTKGTVVNNVGGDRAHQVEIELSPGKPSVWADVASFFASKGGGACFMPEVGDEVLIAFLDGDTNKPVVIGSLFSSKNPPPELFEQPHVRGIQTAAGHSISFDDQADTLTLATKSGAHIELTNAEINIKDEFGNLITMSESDVRIERGNQIVAVTEAAVAIEGKRVEVEAGDSAVVKADKTVELVSKDAVAVAADRAVVLSSKQGVVVTDSKRVEITADTKVDITAGTAMDITAGTKVGISGASVGIKASSNVAIDGSAGVDISTSAVATLRGSLVQIN